MYISKKEVRYWILLILIISISATINALKKTTLIGALILGAVIFVIGLVIGIKCILENGLPADHFNEEKQTGE